MPHSHRIAFTLTIAAAAAAGCGGSTTEDKGLGEPRADLTAAEREAFLRGKKEFTRVYSVKDGLGPLYNADNCGACHDHPTLGGFGDMDHRITVGPLDNDIEEYPSHAIPGFQVRPRPGNVSQRVPPPLYGLGLIEKIPDDFLRAKGCGTGAFHYRDGRVSRFATPTFVYTLRMFIAGALFDEMGISNKAEPHAEADVDDDAAADPEASVQVVEDLTAYVFGLAPPAALKPDPYGQMMFSKFKCDACHRPETGPGVFAYTDLCMHAMGPALADGIVSHDTPEWPEHGDTFRTRPLWGLRHRSNYMHDGRTTSLDEAIRLHAAECDESVKLYTAATQADRDAVIAFLKTL